MMNLNQIRYALAVAEELNFTRAALKCNVSQPPLSRAISDLEREIGARIFERSKHKVSLTSSGRALIADLHHAMHTLERGVERARQIEAGLSGTLRIGFGGSSVYALLPKLVRRFRRAAPDVEVEFCPMPVPGQIDALREDRIHLGVLRLPIFDESLETRDVHSEPLVAALPTGHPMLEKSGPLSVGDLRDESFVAYEPRRGFNYHADLVTLCRLQGFDPKIRHYALTTETVIGIVACAECVAIVPAAAQRLRMHGVAFRALDPDKTVADLLTVKFGLAWRRESHPSPASRFAELAIERNASTTRLTG